MVDAAKVGATVSKIRGFLESHHIQLALAAGTSIIALACVSRRVLPEPMHDLALAIPALVAVIGEGLIAKGEEFWFGRSSVWVGTILLATLLVIGWYLV
jgi:hypothetical protein